MVMCKESSKPSKLSTKLSTIWQINDYLSKKIDNRLIVDIIDTRGHPAEVTAPIPTYPSIHLEATTPNQPSPAIHPEKMEAFADYLVKKTQEKIN